MSEFSVHLTGDYATNAAALQRLLEASLEKDGAEGEIDVRSGSSKEIEDLITPVLGEMLYNAKLADGHPEEVQPESYLHAVRFAWPPEIEGNRALAEAILHDAHEVMETLVEEAVAAEDSNVDEGDLITDGGHTKSYDVEDMEEERLERLANSPLVELILACEDVVGTLNLIKDNQYMWSRLVRDVAKESSKISSEDTAEEIIELAITQMERYGTLGKRPEDEGGDEDE